MVCTFFYCIFAQFMQFPVLDFGLDLLSPSIVPMTFVLPIICIADRLYMPCQNVGYLILYYRFRIIILSILVDIHAQLF